MNPNVRKENETQAAFRIRRKVEAKAEKERAKGRVLWDSSTKGNYHKLTHGKLS